MDVGSGAIVRLEPVPGGDPARQVGFDMGKKAGGSAFGRAVELSWNGGKRPADPTLASAG